VESFDELCREYKVRVVTQLSRGLVVVGDFATVDQAKEFSDRANSLRGINIAKGGWQNIRKRGSLYTA